MCTITVTRFGCIICRVEAMPPRTDTRHCTENSCCHTSHVEQLSATNLFCGTCKTRRQYQSLATAQCLTALLDRRYCDDIETTYARHRALLTAPARVQEQSRAVAMIEVKSEAKADKVRRWMQDDEEPSLHIPSAFVGSRAKSKACCIL